MLSGGTPRAPLLPNPFLPGLLQAMAFHPALRTGPLRKILATGLLAALLVSCASQTPPPAPIGGAAPAECPPVTVESKKPEPIKALFRPAQWSELPDWPGDKLASSWQALAGSCQAMLNKPAWSALCRELPSVTEAERQSFLENKLQAWQVLSSQGSDSGLITGYYEPLLSGSRQPGNGRVPIYGVPADLLTVDLGSLYPELKHLRLRGRVQGNKVVPYYSRAELEANADKPPILAWADDAIELFFLQIQGSGRLQLEDGSLLRLGYADQNGQPYKSIGRWLIDQAQLKAEQASMQGIQAWARANPQRLGELLNQNPSYVFFRQLERADGGPIGAQGLPLTDGASVAIDPRHLPLGAPLYLATSWPNSKQSLNRLMLAQDTGGAIRGPIRADFFWGFGHEAGQLAGKMKQQGKLWLLWPKEHTPPGEIAPSPAPATP